MKHPTKIEGKEIPDLVQEIANLRYDVLAEFLSKLGATLIIDGGKDGARGRISLSRQLQATGIHINQAATSMWGVWRICEPHMKEDHE